MHVLYYAPEYNSPQGGSTHAREFFAALGALPCVSEAHLCCGRDCEESAEATSSPVARARPAAPMRTAALRLVPSAVRAQYRLGFPDPDGYHSLSRALRRGGTDLLVARLGSRFRFLGRLRRDFPSVRVCVEYNACPFDELLRGALGETFWRREEGRQLCKADAVSVVSEVLQGYLSHLAPELNEKVFVNRNGVDPERFRPAAEPDRVSAREAMGIRPDRVVLGYAGGMESFRRLPLVVSQVASMRHHGLERLFLVLLGNGSEMATIENLVRRLPGDPKEWLYCSRAWIPYEQVPQFLSAFDVGLLPYTNPYVSPLKLYEYIACALPVIGPRVASVQQAPGLGDLPLLVEQDGSNFEEVVRRVYDALECYRRQAAQIRVEVLRDSSWTMNAMRVVERFL